MLGNRILEFRVHKRKHLDGTALRLLCGFCLLVLGWTQGESVGAEFARDELNAQLVEAARQEQWDSVHKLVMQGADPNAAQADGMTALHWACRYDEPGMALLLLSKGAHADKPNRYGVTPLVLACQNGDARIAEALLERGAEVDRRLAGGETALMWAARHGSRKTVRVLIQHGADVNAIDRANQNALMWSAAEGHADVVAELLRAGGDRDHRLKSGFTAFFFAVREGRRGAVDVLLRAGVDVNGAMRCERRFNRAPRNGLSGLLLAIENGHFELAAHLLEQGADPNDERSGFTALHAITWVRKPNLGDGVDGDPPPIGSGDMSSLEMVRTLVKHGADINRRLKRGRSGRGRLNQTGATPFLFAADTADVPLMKLLLELGADPTIPNADDCPPLLAAAGIGTMAPGEEAGTEEEAMAAVRLLLDLGADINAVDKNGETVMHGAAYMNAPRLVRLVAQEGADARVWNRPNRYGWTPLQIAAGYRVGNFKPSPETVAAIRQALVDSGIDPPAKIEPPKKSGPTYRRP